MSIKDKKPSSIILILGLILGLGMVFFVFGLKASIISKQNDITLNQCMIYAPKIPYYPNTYITGTIIEDVIRCESGFNNSKIGKVGEIGIAQFMPKTWEYFNKIRGTNLDIYSEEDQLDMINWAFKNNYQKHWTCFKLLYEHQSL